MLLHNVQNCQLGPERLIGKLKVFKSADNQLNSSSGRLAVDHPSSLYHPSLFWTGDNVTGYAKTKVRDIHSIPNLFIQHVVSAQKTAMLARYSLTLINPACSESHLEMTSKWICLVIFPDKKCTDTLVFANA